VLELDIQERPPSTLRNIDGGHPSPCRGEGRSDRHPGSKRRVVDLHRHDRQKIILLMGPILPAISSVMADDP
jgi:hypothetical protein